MHTLNLAQDGTRGLIEQKTEDLGYEVAVGRSPDEKVRGHLPFSEAIDRAIEPIANAFVSSVEHLLVRPDELSVEFGIRLHYRAGPVVSTDLAGSHFKVTLTWNRPSA